MRSKFFLRCVAVLALAALAVPVFAKPISRDISLSHAVKFGKADVQAGDYRLLVDGEKVKLMKGSKVVAELEAKWEQRDTPSPYTAVLINRFGEIEEVRFRGDSRVLVFPRS